MKHTRVVSTKCTPGFACRAFSDTTLVCFIVNEHTTKCSHYILTSTSVEWNIPEVFPCCRPCTCSLQTATISTGPYAEGTSISMKALEVLWLLCCRTWRSSGHQPYSCSWKYPSRTSRYWEESSHKDKKMITAINSFNFRELNRVCVYVSYILLIFWS